MAGIEIVLFGLLGGLMFGAGFKTSYARNQFERRKRRFQEQGRGQNPDTDFIGPHKPFALNVVISGAIIAAICAAIKVFGH